MLSLVTHSHKITGHITVCGIQSITFLPKEKQPVQRKLVLISETLRVCPDNNYGVRWWENEHICHSFHKAIQISPSKTAILSLYFNVFFQHLSPNIRLLENVILYQIVPLLVA